MPQNGFMESHTVSLKNPHFKRLKNDHLYHLGLSTSTHDFPELFRDVKYVCCGGSGRRMEKLANFLLKELDIKLPYGAGLVNLSSTDRYVMYKVGPVLCVNHGIGVPSLSVMLHEVFKLLAHAECGQDVIFFRLGTSGGIGYEPGTVIVSNSAVNGLLQPEHEAFVLGERMKYPSLLDETLSNEIFKLAADFDFPMQQGKTMCADDFYEGQGRLDGALCSYKEIDKVNFLRKAYEAGVRNIEMEASAFSAYTNRAGFKAAIVCVTLVNRLISDQVSEKAEDVKSWEERPVRVVAAYIKQHMQNRKLIKNNKTN